jgi:hypothetical protein
MIIACFIQLFHKLFINIFSSFHLYEFIYQNEVHIDLVNINLKMDLFMEFFYLILVDLIINLYFT